MNDFSRFYYKNVEDETIKFETWCIFRAWKNSMPKLCEVTGGPEQRLTCKELYVRDASLQHYGPSNWVSLRLDIKQN